jgi:hypothetical protein
MLTLAAKSHDFAEQAAVDRQSSSGAAFNPWRMN